MHDDRKYSDYAVLETCRRHVHSRHYIDSDDKTIMNIILFSRNQTIRGNWYKQLYYKWILIKIFIKGHRNGAQDKEIVASASMGRIMMTSLEKSVDQVRYTTTWLWRDCSWQKRTSKDVIWILEKVYSSGWKRDCPGAIHSARASTHLSCLLLICSVLSTASQT